MAASQLTPCPFDRGGAKRCNFRRGSRDEEPPLPFKLDRQGLRLDLNHAIVPPDIQRRSRFQCGLAADLTGNDQTPCPIHGCYHGTNSTIK